MGIVIVCVWRRREKLFGWEIADFYNLIKCKYNGCEAEHGEENEVMKVLKSSDLILAWKHV